MQPKLTADLIVAAGWVLPVAPENTVLRDCAIAVTAGRIAAVGPRAEIDARFETRERIDRPDHALLPGFVDANIDAAAGLLRAVRSGPASASQGSRDLMTLAEHAGLGPDFVHDGTQIAIGEMLLSGITCFADRTLFPEEAARAASAARVRASIGLPFSERPGSWATDATAYLAKSEALWDEYRSDPWISLQFAPEAPETLDDATLARLRRVVDELDARVAMPVSRTKADVAESLARHGARPLARLDALGFLRPGFAALHMNSLDVSDIERTGATGAAVVASPRADRRLHREACPIAELASRGIPVALGTGSALGTGAVDLLAEARETAFTAGAWSTALALRAMTLGGASALGLASDVGSLEPGKAADLVCIDLGSLAARAHGSAPDAIVLGSTRQHVSDVWIAGRAAVTGGRLLALDEDELAALQRQWHERIGARTPG